VFGEGNSPRRICDILLGGQPSREKARSVFDAASVYLDAAIGTEVVRDRLRPGFRMIAQADEPLLISGTSSGIHLPTFPITSFEV
jgi:hypothetical protein